MRSTLVLGCIVFLLVLLAYAPAGLLQTAVEETGTASLLRPRGTLWSGSGELLLQQRSLGAVEWQIKPITLLQGILRYHLTLRAADHDLSGQIDAALNRVMVRLTGSVQAGSVNEWLEPYNITLSGTFDLNDVLLTVENRVPTEADGSVDWTGGSIEYVLSGNLSTGNLPEMTAYLGPGPEAVVFPKGGQTPLLQMALKNDGFAKVGVTKLLTKLLNTPWPGADPDHAVVLEVEEQVF